MPPGGTFGEIVTAGPQIAAGYWGQVDDGGSALMNGEMRTGDVGFMDADGWFYVIDRSNDLINASGYKIWPFEIEQVLQSHPAVRETAVVGIPRRLPWRVDACLRRPATGRGGQRDRTHRVLPQTDGGVQVSARDRDRRRPPAQRDRQGVAPRAPLIRLGSRARPRPSP